MKIYILLLLSIIFVLGCGNTKTEIEQLTTSKSRIKVVDQMTTTDNRTTFYIIQVDEKEFIVQLHGGMCPLLKKDKH